jgi:hypothetical protein
VNYPGSPGQDPEDEDRKPLATCTGNGHGTGVGLKAARPGKVRYAGPGGLQRPMAASDLRSELMP